MKDADQEVVKREEWRKEDRRECDVENESKGGELRGKRR